MKKNLIILGLFILLIVSMYFNFKSKVEETKILNEVCDRYHKYIGNPETKEEQNLRDLIIYNIKEE